jgi:hypothetical protein
VADVAIASALDMLATRGDAKGLDRWLERSKGREMSGPAASRAARARETRAFIAAHPERVIASGPKALELLDLREIAGRPCRRFRATSHA